MIIATNICLTLGGKDIFDDISFNFEQRQKIGLVGRNGAGKSTMLKAIAGQLQFDSGALTIERRKQIAYMPQEVVLHSNKTVLDEAISSFEDVYELKQKRDSFEKYFQQHDEKSMSQEQLEQYAELQAHLVEVDIDAKIVEATKVLQGLGFSVAERAKMVDQLSVGWKMRLVLAKLLLQKADFYLFDEPTNHLDIVAKDWFLEFLKNSSSGFLLVSHDRFFLDHLCTHIYELDRGNGKIYRGNYTTFREQKEKDREALESAYVVQQKEIKKKMEVINKFKAKASKASMAQSMLKSLEKMEVIEIDSKPKAMRLNFSDVKRSGQVVLKVEGLSKTFNDRQIFKDIAFEVGRGDKAAIVASNGQGKTTLLNIIAKNSDLESGSVQFGHNVETAIFEQDQEKSLNQNKTILEEVEESCKTSEARAQVRALLGAFLFPGDDVHKKIRVLSGGEKNRVAMVKVFLQKANFLILDEPTNHLDLESKEVLLEALRQFPGTILFVSHDRGFLDDLATRIFELTPAGIASYEGNYESYLYQKAKREELLNPGSAKPSVAATVAKPQEAAKPHLDGKEAYEARKKAQRLESKLAKLEAERDALMVKLVTIEYGSGEFVMSSRRIEELKGLIATAYAEWDALQNK